MEQYNQVKDVLDEIRPSLVADGGDLELVAVEGDVVKIRLKGACSGCPMSALTLKMGIEKYLKQKISWIKEVKSV
ncbi:NifU family protein [bacterium]|nr:NifU family protein [bacterium]